MTDTSSGPPAAPQKDHGRAGRDLRAAVLSALVLLAAIGTSLFFFKTAFMVIVAGAVVVAVWELRQGMLLPRDLIGTALFLAGDASRRVTGHTIAVDDGYLAA